MTVDEAKHKMDFLKKAYQKLIDEKVDSGKLIGDGVMGEWKAETPIDEAYKSMIEALEIAINVLEQQPCKDCISREAVRKLICQNNDKYGYSDRFHEFTERCLQLPSVTPKAGWIPIKTRPMTEEEKEEIGHEYAYMYDCPLPDDGQDVLITDCHGNVEVDTFCRDCEGFYFEINCDDGEVTAWMPLPEPYRESEIEEK